MLTFFEEFKQDFITCFIVKNRYKYILQGLGNTVKIAFCAVLLGILIGSVVAVIRSTYDKYADEMADSFKKSLLKLADAICRIYVTIIRGTPVMIQLMIMFFVIFSTSRDGLPVAILTFGINSGAYVAEIIRGGIMAVDKGQEEAGRSLGLGYVDTTINIIIPQALKSVLPSLANEFIALLKETSVACYVAVNDLTKGGDIIRSVTYIQAMPLLAVALLYLAMVAGLSYIVDIWEAKLRKNDR